MVQGSLPASEAVVVVVGCGPVGLCAIVSAMEYAPKHLFAVDSVDSRLEVARSLGAEPLNFLQGKDTMLSRVKEVTGGRGADAVIEVVGLSPALRTAFDLLRPFGSISSIGVHNAEVSAPFGGLWMGGWVLMFGRFRGAVTRLMGESGLESCGGWAELMTCSKNLRLQMGRCPVRSVAQDALKVLVKNQDKFR